MKPFRIFIGGEELERYTRAKLSRLKKNLTGSFECEVFFESVPTSPQIVQAVRGKEILVYVHGQLAFTGKIDKRNGKTTRPRNEKGQFTKGSDTSESSGSVNGNFSEQGYTVTITARGKTKYLIDSSHGQTVTTMSKTTDKKIIETLLSKFDVELDWQGEENDVRLSRFRDGTRTALEIFNVCNEHCHFVYESRDGKMLVTDQARQIVGANLVLGENILSFSAEQSEDQANSQIVAKGHRNDPEIWGEDAITVPVESVEDLWVESNIPLNLQCYGDAEPKKIQKRAKYEADRRAAESKNITVTTFGLDSNGAAWDLGVLHYTEIPCEGVFDVFECVGVDYEVNATDTLQTTLTLAPPPSNSIAGGAQNMGNSLLSNISNALNDLTKLGASRRAQSGVQIIPGLYPSSWTGAALSIVANPIIGVAAMVNSLLKSPQSQNQKPPLTLPDD